MNISLLKLNLKKQSFALCLFSYSETNNEPRSETVTDPLAILLEARFEPCQVCGEQSSGLHCGAITCEACKVRERKK